jgi:endonuclease YncB( thermonuclease family)
MPNGQEYADAQRVIRDALRGLSVDIRPEDSVAMRANRLQKHAFNLLNQAEYEAGQEGAGAHAARIMGLVHDAGYALGLAGELGGASSDVRAEFGRRVAALAQRARRGELGAAGILEEAFGETVGKGVKEGANMAVAAGLFGLAVVAPPIGVPAGIAVGATYGAAQGYEATGTWKGALFGGGIGAIGGWISPGLAGFFGASEALGNLGFERAGEGVGYLFPGAVVFGEAVTAIGGNPEGVSKLQAFVNGVLGQFVPSPVNATDAEIDALGERQARAGNMGVLLKQYGLPPEVYNNPVYQAQAKNLLLLAWGVRRGGKKYLDSAQGKARLEQMRAFGSGIRANAERARVLRTSPRSGLWAAFRGESTLPGFGGKELPRPAKEPWKMTQSEYRADQVRKWGLIGRKGETESFHEELVLRAVREGKPVPAEVLKDYPYATGEAAALAAVRPVEIRAGETPEGKVVPVEIGKRVQDILGKSMMGEPTPDVIRVGKYAVDYWKRQTPEARQKWYRDMRHKFANLFSTVKGRRQLDGEFVSEADFDNALRTAIRETMNEGVSAPAPAAARPPVVPAVPRAPLRGPVTRGQIPELRRLGWLEADTVNMTAARAFEIIGGRIKGTFGGGAPTARTVPDLASPGQLIQWGRIGSVQQGLIKGLFAEAQKLGKGGELLDEIERVLVQREVENSKGAPEGVRVPVTKEQIAKVIQDGWAWVEAQKPAPSGVPKLADILGVPSAAELEVDAAAGGAFPRGFPYKARERDLRAWNWVEDKQARLDLGPNAQPRARRWYEVFTRTLLRDYPAEKSVDPSLTIPKYLERVSGAVFPNAFDRAMDAADMEIYGKVQRVREQATPEPAIERIAGELPPWIPGEGPRKPLPGIPVVRRTGKAPKSEPARGGGLAPRRIVTRGGGAGLLVPDWESVVARGNATPAQVQGLRAKLNASPAGRKILLGLSVAGTVMSVDVLTIWLSSDNLMTGFGYTAQMITQQVKSGSISPEEGLRQIDELERRKNETATFIRTSTYLNPLLWLFGKQYRQNIGQTEQRLAIARQEIGLSIMPEEFEVEVLRVIDGDTVEVALDAVDLKTGKRVRLPVAKWGDQGVSIRTAGVNAPEMGAEWGTKPTKKGKLVESIFPKKDYMPPQYADKAKDMLAPLVGKRIRVFVDKTDLKDDNGRIVGRIEFGGKDMGFELLKAGLGQAWNYKPNKQVDVAKYEKETADAVREKRGGWKGDFPVLKGKVALPKLGRYTPTQGVSGGVVPFNPQHPMGEGR